jgi:hypothetical protein
MDNAMDAHNRLAAERPVKVRLVKRWVEGVAPGHGVHEFEEPARSGYSFRIDHTDHALLTLSDEFLDERLDPEERKVATVLDRLGIAARLRTAGKQTRVLVTSNGGIQERKVES